MNPFKNAIQQNPPRPFWYANRAFILETPKMQAFSWPTDCHVALAFPAVKRSDDLLLHFDTFDITQSEFTTKSQLTTLLKIKF